MFCGKCIVTLPSYIDFGDFPLTRGWISAGPLQQTADECFQSFYNNLLESDSVEMGLFYFFYGKPQWQHNHTATVASSEQTPLEVSWLQLLQCAFKGTNHKYFLLPRIHVHHSLGITSRYETRDSYSGCQVPWKELKHLNVVQAYKEQAMIQQWGVKVGSNIANQEELTTSKPQLPLTLDW